MNLRSSFPFAVRIHAALFGQMLLLAVLGWGMCGGGRAFAASNTSPTITSVSPSCTTAGGAGFTLTVNGAGFTPNSVVRWNGSKRTTSFRSKTQLTAAIQNSDVANPGTAQVTVSNGVISSSNAVIFYINSPVPALGSMVPSYAIVGGGDFTLAVNGTGFIATSVLRWNGSNRETTVISSTQLSAAIPSTDIATAGTVPVTVFNPAANPGVSCGSDGGTSDVLSFTINNPSPSLTALSPSSVLAGGTDFSLSIIGSGFASTSAVLWNNSTRPTRFVSSTQLTATISAGDIASPGAAQVAVFNPTPGGGTSNFLAFAINKAVFSLASLSPASIPAGGADFTLTATGTSFTSSSVVRWNGSDRATTFVSSTSLRAVILASDIANPGTAQASVFDPGEGTSSALTLVITQNRVGVLERVSVTTDGGVASADGRFVAFTFAGSFADVFLRDTCRGPSAPVGCTPSTVLVSVANDGSLAAFDTSYYYDYYSSQGLVVIFECSFSGAHDANTVVFCLGSSVGSISSDGRFVSFSSDAINLVPGDTNGGRDVFVRDTCVGAPAGCMPSTFRVSVASDGSEGNNESTIGSLSADGRFVAFSSSASNLIPGDTNGVTDVFVRDTCFGASAGCMPSTFRVSVASDGTQANDASGHGRTISKDGRFVSFFSHASNLVADDTNGVLDAFVRDTCVGAPAGCMPSTFRVSVASDGSEGNNESTIGSLSADGRFVAFVSNATNLVPEDTNGATDVFVRDTCLGAGTACVPSTVRVSVSSDGSQGNRGSSGGVLSSDGRFVSFSSYANNFSSDDTNGVLDVFVRDTCLGAGTGCVPSTVRVSVASDGSQGDGNSFDGVLSGDGYFVVFTSWADNLVTGDTSTCGGIFLASTGR